MGLTIGEANAFNWATNYLLGQRHVEEKLAVEGMELLAARASKTLMAGLKPEDIKPAVERWKAGRADEALDGAMFTIWRFGKWRLLTSKMTPAEWEAAADAVIRYDREHFDDPDSPIDVHAVRWWR